MDKSWLTIRNRADRRYIRGIDGFLDWAYNQPNASSMICCPCKGCMNTVFKLRNVIRLDLLKKGFWDSYKVWDLHGDVFVGDDNSHNVRNDEVEDDNVGEDDITEIVHDACGCTKMEESCGSRSLATVLGKRTGYARGNEYGKKPPNKSRMQQANFEASLSFAIEKARQEMRANMNQKFQEKREQMRAEMVKRFQDHMEEEFRKMRVEMEKRIQDQIATVFVRMQQQGQSSSITRNDVGEGGD
ncbi:uncharacterized protein LOC107790148 isoform X1 [Nicotiana tabacum]|uniref:Uncharacterized protein isoform X1 n=3 Tax=Nicotiana tabacum TaxID=4097 RepID=A0A1S3ZT44_TOBAC|nr:PREDICTED: uncharacterized protein LOC107790148 isoform X1 [Nicotiana tabacum]XP_016467537.1 PREDICTED: uncharacterized protein LOC107790148 isoform X1 [Nicotiana tabacum]